MLKTKTRISLIALAFKGIPGVISIICYTDLCVRVSTVGRQYACPSLIELSRRDQVKRIVVVACISLLAGCVTTGQKTSVVDQQIEAFQLHTAPDGRVYRIDTRTGNTSWLDGTTFRAVAEPTMPQLAVGKVYRGEDGTFTYRYQGSGKLEKWGLDKYNSAPQQSTPGQR